MDSQKSRLIRLLTLYGIGIVSVFLWYLYMGDRQSLAGFASLNIFYIFLAMSSVLPITFLEALCLHFYLSAKRKISLKKVVQLYLLISPIGYFLSFYSIPLSAFLSWTLFAIPARVLFAGLFYTQVFTAIFPALTLLLFPLPSSSPALASSLVSLVRLSSLFILSLSLFFLINSSVKLTQKGLPPILQKLKAPFTIPLPTFARITFVSLVIFVLQYLTVFIAIRYGLGLHSSHTSLLSIAALSGLSSLIPNLPADLGLQEIKGSLFLYLLHYPKEKIAAAILTFHAFSAFFIFILIIIAIRVDWEAFRLAYRRTFHAFFAAPAQEELKISKNG